MQASDSFKEQLRSVGKWQEDYKSFVCGIIYARNMDMSRLKREITMDVWNLELKRELLDATDECERCSDGA